MNLITLVNLVEMGLEHRAANGGEDSAMERVSETRDVIDVKNPRSCDAGNWKDREGLGSRDYTAGRVEEGNEIRCSGGGKGTAMGIGEKCWGFRKQLGLLATGGETMVVRALEGRRDGINGLGEGDRNV